MSESDNRCSRWFPGGGPQVKEKKPLTTLVCSSYGPKTSLQASSSSVLSLSIMSRLLSKTLRLVLQQQVQRGEQQITTKVMMLVVVYTKLSETLS